VSFDHPGVVSAVHSSSLSPPAAVVRFATRALPPSALFVVLFAGPCVGDLSFRLVNKNCKQNQLQRRSGGRGITVHTFTHWLQPQPFADLFSGQTRCHRAAPLASGTWSSCFLGLGKCAVWGSTTLHPSVSLLLCLVTKIMFVVTCKSEPVLQMEWGQTYICWL
jgi:hypothetical protein